MALVRSIHPEPNCFVTSVVAPWIKKRDPRGTFFKFSGIGDEAGPPITKQIRAHRALQEHYFCGGWENIDLRLVEDSDGTIKNVTLINDVAFERVADLLAAANIQVHCFASSVANWNRPVTGDPQIDINELVTAIPRMKRVGAPFIRVMSWQKVPGMDDSQVRDLVFQRMRRLVDIAESEGVHLLHENCAGWGGDSWQNSVALVQAMDSPNFGLLWDPGNVVEHFGNPWDFWEKTRDLTRYIHIKDGVRLTGGEMIYTMPGEGQGQIFRLLVDLKNRQYEGIVSIEPHLAAVIHLGTKADPEKLSSTYVDYGRRMNEFATMIFYPDPRFPVF